jgi:hypothetical protein
VTHPDFSHLRASIDSSSDASFAAAFSVALSVVATDPDFLQQALALVDFEQVCALSEARPTVAKRTSKRDNLFIFSFFKILAKIIPKSNRHMADALCRAQSL